MNHELFSDLQTLLNLFYEVKNHQKTLENGKKKVMKPDFLPTPHRGFDLTMVNRYQPANLYAPNI